MFFREATVLKEISTTNSCLLFGYVINKEYLTNFNSNMAFIMLINASIYQKFTTYFN